MNKNMPSRKAACMVFLCLSCNCIAGVTPTSCMPQAAAAQETNEYSPCEAALNDARSNVETFYTTLAGAITSSTSGGISSVCSLLIIILILRSTIRLSTVYHRIMFGMSVVDLISSLAMALSTLPLPKDMIYNHAGWTIGNELSCTVQGFAVLFGVMATLYYNTSLFLYYLLCIRRKMDDATIKKCIEPLMHAASILLALPVPIMGAYGELLNPYPYSSWCTLHSIPYFCDLTSDDAPSCVVRGKLGIMKNISVYYVSSSIFAGLILQIVFFALTICSVYQQERYIRRVMTEMKRKGANLSRFGDASEGKLSSTQKRHSYTKVLLIQGLAYFIAFMVCQISSFSHIRERKRSGWGFQIYNASCRPLQGFFNFVIFVGHKTYDTMRLNPQMSTRKAIINVLSRREEKRVYLSNVSLVCIEDDMHFDGDEDEDEGGGDEGLVSHENRTGTKMSNLMPQQSGEDVLSKTRSQGQSGDDEELSSEHWPDSGISFSLPSGQSRAFSEAVSSMGK